MAKENLTRIGLKNDLTLPSFAYKNFNSLGDEDDEPIYKYTDPFLRNFVRDSIEGAGCNSFNQHYKSEFSDEVFEITPKELNVNGNICDLLERYFEFLNKYEEPYAIEFDSKYDVYRDSNQKGKTAFINGKINMLSVVEQLSKLIIYILLKWILTQLFYILEQCGKRIVFILKWKLLNLI